MNIFNPKSVKKDTKSTKIVFTGFSLFNQPVNVRTNENTNSPLLRNINSVEEIRLKYSESVFTIDYLGINYSSPERIQYAYILEGSDKSWNYVQNKRSVTYRNLPPGIYIFKVKASSLAGIFDDENIRTLKIIVEPPLWMTWWAYSIYLLLFLLGIYFIGVIVTIKVRASNRIKYERIEREKSEKLYKDKLQFFTNISHELRTPLTLILSPIDKLLSSEKNESNRYLLSLIRKNAVRVISNVNEIIDIRKIDREQMSLRVAEVEIISFFREIVSAFEDVASTKHINLMFHSVEESLIGWISTKFVDKIIYNIISNAFKFTPEYGEIIININGFERNGRMNLSIEISDTGIGIANKDINRIFERFYQIESDNSSIIRQGAGIGLHLVKSLVELHKGDINVQSKVDKGTCVTVVLPISVNAYTKDEVSIIPPLLTSIHKTEIGQGLLKETKLPMSNMSEDLNKKYKILVVEDEADIRNFIALELSDEYDVILAENGKDGLEKALSVIPDLIVSDILMPEMDGIEFCRKIKEDINTSHIPVILLTAKDSHEDRLHGLEVGADSYIPKPFDNRHLHIRIKQLIKSREAVKQKYLQKIEKFSKGYVNKENTLPNIPSRDDILIQKIVSYINENITDPDLKGESIAEYISISRMSLHRKLKALTDLSAGDLIREMRLEFACKLLKETDKTITEISYESGFSSPSYFYTCFVKKYGIAPSEYNKQQDKE